MPIEKLEKPTRIDEERIQKLKELFPEAFADGKLNLEILQEEINGIDEQLIENNTEESYGLQWVGKKEARRLAFLPPQGTLKFVEGEGVNEDKTKNIVIEGDNLEVLRILQKSYAGRIKLIYIDPPYNTGNDFIYKDDFREPLEKYLYRSGQLDEEGLLTSNPKSSGRFHANWLSMMYPRLKLARNLLRNDGIICVSISDIEEANLRKLLDEIFGEENFINTVSVKSKVSAGASGGGEDKRLKKNIEYIHIYAKNIDNIDPLVNLYQNVNLMNLINEMREEGQSWKYTSVLVGYGEREKLITIEDGEGNPIDIYLRKNVKRKTVAQLMKEEDLSEEQVYKKYLDRIFSDTNAQSSIRTRVIEAVGHLPEGAMYEVEYTPRSGKMKGKKVTHHYISNTVRRVIWLKDVAEIKDGVIYKKERLSTLWEDIDFNNVGKEGGISFPNGKKPIELIKRCISIDDDPEGIILDFFAGSGSTGHAVLDLNRLTGGNRKFILVQIPEKAKETEYETIVEITKERLKKSIQELNEQANNIQSEDLGFAFYRLSKTNIRKWNGEASENIEQLEANLDMIVNAHFTDGWTEKDVIIELMLNQGFPLDSCIEQVKEIDKNKVWVVKHEDIPFAMYVCLDQSLHSSTVDYLVKAFSKDVFICLDDALNNEQKILLGEEIKVKTI
ncbi:site-specific DNA-methyltransferase [Anoxybacillus ayderensis]|nr:site-specific DNA-methyltransferase [Anoxybacillus ayderensis]